MPENMGIKQKDTLPKIGKSPCLKPWFSARLGCFFIFIPFMDQKIPNPVPNPKKPSAQFRPIFVIKGLLRTGLFSNQLMSKSLF